MCRIQLINEQEYDDDDDSDEEFDEEEEDEEEDDEEEEEEEDDFDDEINGRKVTHEQLSCKLTNLGYTPADFLRIAGCRVKSSQTGKYVCAFFKKFREDVDKIILGEIKMADRDTRTYAQVVNNK